MSTDSSPSTGADALWDAVQRRIARPRPSRLHRLARAFGAPEDDLVLLDAAGDLRLPWSIALGGALAVALIAGYAPVHSHAVFLLLGPVVPVLAVIAAYDATDSLRELTTATPYSKVRLGLLRSLAVLMVAIPTMLLVGWLVPVFGGPAWAWLLPSFLLTAVSLVLLGRLTARRTGTVVAAAWGVVVVSVEAARGSEVLATPGVQAVFAALAAAVLATRMALEFSVPGRAATGTRTTDKEVRS